MRPGSQDLPARRAHRVLIATFRRQATAARTDRPRPGGKLEATSRRPCGAGRRGRASPCRRHRRRASVGHVLIDDGFLNSALDEHQTYGHGAEGSVPGPQELPSGPKELGLKLIGKTINAPEFGDLGRVADVSAKGNYAYLTMFYEPQCGRGGVQIVDISNPANPVKRGYIPSHVDTFSGEGSQVVTMDTPVIQGRPARLPERVVPADDQRRRRHLARRRQQPGPPEEARRGRRRLHEEVRRRSRTACRRPRPTRRTPRSRGRARATAAGTSCSSTTWRSPTSTSSTSPTRASRSSWPSGTSTRPRRPAPAGRTATPSSATTWWSRRSAARTSC